MLPIFLSYYKTLWETDAISGKQSIITPYENEFSSSPLVPYLIEGYLHHNSSTHEEPSSHEERGPPG